MGSWQRATLLVGLYTVASIGKRDNGPLWIDGVPAQLADHPLPPAKNRQFLTSALGTNTFFPVFSTHPLDVPGMAAQQEVAIAVVWIHGAASNANKYYADGVSAAKGSGMGEKTITIAPWFGKTQVNGSYWNADLLHADAVSLYWYDDVKSSHWLAGGYSASMDASDSKIEVENGRRTSFALMDYLVSRLQDKSVFPSLERITIAGFSAGCQMGSRWAFFSNQVLPRDGSANVQVIVSDCSSYMYLDDKRPAESCRKKYDTGAAHSCSEFHGPSFVSPSHYNKYKYGLDGAAGDIVYDTDQLKKYQEEFSSKDVRFIFGTQDVCSCVDPEYENPSHCFHPDLKCLPVFGHNTTCCDTYPDTDTSNAFDTEFAAEKQGSSRLQRGLNYVNYLKHFYKGQWAPLHGTFVGGHDNSAFGNCELFNAWAFKGTSTEATTITV